LIDNFFPKRKKGIFCNPKYWQKNWKENNRCDSIDNEQQPSA